MRVAYIQGFAGVSGPTLLGAVLDAGVSLQTLQDGWRQLPLPAVEVTLQRIALADHAATAITFSAPEIDAWLAQHTAASLYETLAQSPMPARVRQLVLHTLRRLAEATGRLASEAQAAYALCTAWLPDILYMGSGVALGLESLGITACSAAPLNLGAGFVETAHGRMGVPRPLTAALVQGVPVYGDTVPGERTTVGGAAILTALATQFGPMPAMTVAQTGYGTASTDGTSPALQLILGDTDSGAAADRIAVLETNIDDMNPEFYEDIYARLFAHGALDVTLTPLFMKKNRPANKLTVLSPLTHVESLSNLMLQETSTFGVRVYEVWRRKLERFSRPVETRYGVVAVKCGVLEGRMIQAAPEYEVCKQLAHRHRIPVRLVYAEAARLASAWLVDDPL